MPASLLRDDDWQCRGAQKFNRYGRLSSDPSRLEKLAHCVVT
jgi:hypothetical protein